MEDNFIAPDQNSNDSGAPAQPFITQEPELNPQPQPNKRPSKIWLYVLIIVMVLIIGGGLYYFFIYRPSTEKNTADNTSQTASNKSSVTGNGLVAFDEVGCQGQNLSVMSASGNAPVDEDGNYTASFSTTSAQLISLVSSDQKTICATAISLPNFNNKVHINSKSTAQSLVFASILGIDPVSAQAQLDAIDKFDSFPALYAYVKTNLPKSDVNTLSNDQNLLALQQKCSEELIQLYHK